MPNRKLEYRQKLLNNRCRELQREITELRLKRELKESDNPQESTPPPKLEPKQPEGGKWFGNGDRAPTPQEINPKNLPEMLKELDQLRIKNK